MRTGATLRALPVGQQPVAQGVDATTNRVFVVNKGTGTLTVLDAQTGVMRAALKVCRQPIAVAVDERRERMFIVNTRRGAHGSVTVLGAG